MMVSAVTATARTRNASPKIEAASASSRFIVMPRPGRSLFHADERAHGLLPSLRAAGIDLVAGFRPRRIRDVAHGRLHGLKIARLHRHGNEAELLAGGTRVLAGIAVHRVIPQRLGIDPDVVGELFDAGLQLLLLVGCELVPGSEVDRVALHGHL